MSSRPRGSAAAGRRPAAPAPTPVLATTLEPVLAALRCDPLDHAVLATAVQQMGSPDPMLGDTIGSDRRTLSQAAAEPLHRSSADVRSAGTLPTYYTETVVAPSGRVFQVQRRYATEAEVEAFLTRRASHAVPAVWIRELLVPPARVPADATRAVMYDAATVVEDEPEADANGDDPR